MKEKTEEESNQIQDEKNSEEKKEKEIKEVSWKLEALKGNFMPSMVMLEQNKINVNEIVNPSSKETLLHLAGRFGYFNVMRTLIEKFHADINVRNINGHSLLFLIVSSTGRNLVHFYYLINQENLEIDIADNYGMSPLSHSILTNFHFPFLYFINAGLLNKSKDIYGNHVIYFALVNDNKFALSYFLDNKKIGLANKFFNNSQTLSDILITCQYNSITKFLVKYYWSEIDLNNIMSCRKNILSFNAYNVYNYELLNTLYYFKTKNYIGFISAILKRNNIENERKQIKDDINDNKILSQNNYGYYYKYINLRMMFYNLLLPIISPLYKFLSLFIYFSLIYFICNEENNPSNPNPRISNIKYEITSFSLLIITIILMFTSKINIIPKKKTDLEEEISTQLLTDLKSLPDIEEICPSCVHVKKISSIHCYLCKGCVPYKIFHSNLFSCCISKSNINEYLIYILLKINFYYICLMNILKSNPTDNSIRSALVPFRHITSLKTFVIQTALLAVMIINIGQFIGLLLVLSVKTPYKYIYKLEKRVYYKGIEENQLTRGIIQVPEINDQKKIKNIFSFLFKNE